MNNIQGGRSVIQTTAVHSASGPSNKKKIQQDLFMVMGDEGKEDCIQILSQKDYDCGASIEPKSLDAMYKDIKSNCSEFTPLLLIAHGWGDRSGRYPSGHQVHFAGQSSDTGKVLQQIRALEVRNGNGEMTPFKGPIFIGSCGIGAMESWFNAEKCQELAPVFLLSGQSERTSDTSIQVQMGNSCGFSRNTSVRMDRRANLPDSM